MQQGRPTQLSVISKEMRIRQTMEQIKTLEIQLDNAKRDLKRLQRERNAELRLG